MSNVKRAITIAGSDSGGGAGIQADLKTFAAFGIYGTSVITAITAQNTRKVTQVLELPPELVAAQIDAVMSDIGTDAAKTGMLANAQVIQIVAQKIGQWHIPNLVVDPVMIAKSGDRLLQENATQALRDYLLPLATVVTPNIPEAEVLVGCKLETDQEIRRAAKKIVALGARNVIMKGGHRKGPVTDLLYGDGRFVEFTTQRIQTSSTHGTGCTFASAIAACLAKGDSLESAVSKAKDYITQAIQHAYPIGRGHGPVHHFYRLWEA